MSPIEELTKELTIEKLFLDNKYIIPIYQRNYAWEEPQVVQLIVDINDYAIKKECKDYYIGTLIVFEREKDGEIIYETIDGQQRLTTLFILLTYLKNEKKSACKFKPNLDFESREISSHTLKVLFNNEEHTDMNVNILEAYEVIKKQLKKLDDINGFAKYLLHHVKILRVSVPKDTDLNHYFEIMNNRGEQLEMHEVLKAQMLEKLQDDKDDMYIFNAIWEACSNMDQYIQYGFNTTDRKKIFGNNWNTFNVKTFDDIKIDIDKKEDEDETIEDLIKPIPKNPSQKNNNEEPSESFTSPINFSNFLLHVLRIQTSKNIPLDDKRLLDIFKNKDYVKDYDKEFVKNFAFNLLKLKFLSDKYIIKREYLKGNDSWSLKQFQKKDDGTGYYKNTFNDNNTKILMLLSMFHVSAPTLVYKHWFNATLKFVYENEKIDAETYIRYLENLAKAYLYDRYLYKKPSEKPSEKPLDYYDIIYKNKGEKKNSDSDIDITLLDKGTNVENFIFNYLDYLLWAKESTKYSKFEFAFRSSIEHYYPQNPMKKIAELKEDIIHDFGNLCIVSRSENSRLSNFTPKAKKEFYTKQSNNSIKQQIMMHNDEWTEKEIEKHGNKMKEILLGE